MKTQVTHRNICIIYPWKEVRGQHLVMVLVLLLICCSTRLAGPLASPGTTSQLPTSALGLQMCVAVLKFMCFLEIRTQVLTLLWQALLVISYPRLWVLTCVVTMGWKVTWFTSKKPFPWNHFIAQHHWTLLFYHGCIHKVSKVWRIPT